MTCSVYFLLFVTNHADNFFLLSKKNNTADCFIYLFCYVLTSKFSSEIVSLPPPPPPTSWFAPLAICALWQEAALYDVGLLKPDAFVSCCFFFLLLLCSVSPSLYSLITEQLPLLSPATFTVR